MEQLLLGKKALVAGNPIKEGVNACILGIHLPSYIDACIKWLLLSEEGSGDLWVSQDMGAT